MLASASAVVVLFSYFLFNVVKARPMSRISTIKLTAYKDLRLVDQLTFYFLEKQWRQFPRKCYFLLCMWVVEVDFQVLVNGAKACNLWHRYGIS